MAAPGQAPRRTFILYDTTHKNTGGYSELLNGKSLRYTIHARTIFNLIPGAEFT
jgi:hypothetical protein